MRRSPSLIGVLCVLSTVAYGLETQVRFEERAPNSDTIIHHPAASLSIAGDLKDLKLKSSIAQLVRALQTPSAQADPRIQAPKPDLVTKQNSNVHSSQARKLIYGLEVPEPVVISSQSIRINSNKTGGKRSRGISSSSEVDDADGVRTIEGVRVPDDEHDKHHTWRNARVIKNFLVPNNRAPNPHRKRQVVVHTDPQSYMAAAAAAAAQGATTIVDTAVQQHGRPVAYTQSDLANAAAYLAQNQPYHQQYQPQPQQQPVQPPHQYQQYQLPSAAQRSPQSGQTTAFTYAQQPGQQMYVLQDDGGNTYVQYSSPVQTGQTQAQPVSQLFHSQSQFSSRSGEPAAPTIAQSSQQTVASPSQVQKNSGTSNSPQQLQQQISQAQAAVQAIQQLRQAPSQVQQPSAQVSEVSGGQAAHQKSVQDILTAAASSGSNQYILQAAGQSRSSGGSSNTFSGAGAVQAASQNSFVIQPQTYVTGPGGQTFTIPVPVPADQASGQPQQQPGRQDWHQQHHPHHNQPQNYRQNPHAKSRNNFADRIMEALHVSKKGFERMDTTTAVVPALASTGIFLGLSALAAGWYLSQKNREVGIVRRTGKPASHRFRRDAAAAASSVNNYPQEVDQATFFQSIIQQSLEKTQQQYENQEPAYNNLQQQDPVYSREPEAERHRPNKNSRISRPQNRDDNDSYYDNHKSPKTPYAQEKSGAVTIGSSKNFAKVFIPALILGLSVISITALIFFWYLTGNNREIAFLEPSSHSRKKRSLMGSTALSDGWLQKAITAIHHNPYDRMPAPTSKSLLPHPFMNKETKTSSTRQLKNGRANQIPSSFALNNSHLKHLRAPRSLTDGYNDLDEPDTNNPGFLSSIMTSIEDAQQSIVSSLHDVGLFDSKSGCSKRLVCEILLSEDDTTLRTTEKKVTTFFDMLPNSVSKSWRESFDEIVSAVEKRDCSAFSCGVGSVEYSSASNSR
ncbi:uncharacterized protein LOC110844142 isoform X2 [Folsomia candida]|uniref:uncharacterized protein LOC110844142 isoform X2 n=1 Tax=Folsomia candida TaxID=158441 RepID=UPI000B8F3A6F|nr:uncharacterized protein LOC110844142 isoform X2 [Folsomia candida]